MTDPLTATIIAIGSVESALNSRTAATSRRVPVTA